MLRRRIILGLVAGFLAAASGTAGFPHSPIEAEEHHAAFCDGMLVTAQRPHPAIRATQIPPTTPRRALTGPHALVLSCRATPPHSSLLRLGSMLVV